MLRHIQMNLELMSVQNCFFLLVRNNKIYNLRQYHPLPQMFLPRVNQVEVVVRIENALQNPAKKRQTQEELHKM